MATLSYFALPPAQITYHPSLRRLTQGAWRAQVAFLYFTVCMQSLRREWFGIDRLRLDKFMLLIRHFLRQLFQHLSNLEWCAAIPRIPRVTMIRFVA